MLKRFLATVVVLLIVLCAGGRLTADERRPNLLWITFEDIGPDLGCYGVEYADTPRLDQFAREGVRYTRAWSNAGMCAPARATLITGMYPPSTGAQNMRSEVLLPEHIRGFPEYLRDAGYYTSNHVKTDYNWIAPESTWTKQSRDWRNDGWRGRETGQPFFTVINITDTHSSQLYWRGEQNYQRRMQQLGPDRRHDRAGVPVPPYYPDLPEVREDLARYHDNITYADGLVGEILDQLEADGLAKNTIVFYFSDHGRGMPRSKGWCFYSSLHVPLIIRFPQKFASLAPTQPGGTEDRIVSFVDFAPTVLSLAGIDPPEHMQGAAFLGEHSAAPRRLAYSYRDRMDERYDLVRSVWDGRYHYIRNFFPHLPWFHRQTRDYPHTQPTYTLWQQRADEGALAPDAALYMSRTRPGEMLFDTQADPHEMHNLADDRQQQERLQAFRRELRDWQREIVDLGMMPESIWVEQFEARGDATPRYTLVRQHPELYPLPKLQQIADELLDAGKAPQMLEAFGAQPSVVRFWGGLSLLASGADSPDLRAACRQALSDESPTLRVLAAQTLGELGETDESLPVLLQVLNNEPPLVALQAANALDHLGERARPVLGPMREFVERQSTLDARQQPLGAEFPVWVLRNSIERLED